MKRLPAFKRYAKRSDKDSVPLTRHLPKQVYGGKIIVTNSGKGC